MTKSVHLGQRFGRLVIDHVSHKTSSGGICWCCKCSCGNVINKISAELNSGDAISCGCIWKEHVARGRK